ncbi:hypothetical protein ACTXT7_004829 [Hymenolepis weldensis]
MEMGTLEVNLHIFVRTPAIKPTHPKLWHLLPSALVAPSVFLLLPSPVKISDKYNNVYPAKFNEIPNK